MFNICTIKNICVSNCANWPSDVTRKRVRKQALTAEANKLRDRSKSLCRRKKENRCTFNLWARA